MDWLFKLVTPAQVGGIVRALVAAVAGGFIAKGIGDASLWDAVGGALVTAVVGFWSWKVKT